MASPLTKSWRRHVSLVFDVAVGRITGFSYRVLRRCPAATYNEIQTDVSTDRAPLPGLYQSSGRYFLDYIPSGNCLLEPWPLAIQTETLRPSSYCLIEPCDCATVRSQTDGLGLGVNACGDLKTGNTNNWISPVRAVKDDPFNRRRVKWRFQTLHSWLLSTSIEDLKTSNRNETVDVHSTCQATKGGHGSSFRNPAQPNPTQPPTRR